MTYMRDMHAILERCGLNPPPFEEWHAYYSENTELWPLRKEYKLVGGILFKGHTLHVAVDPEWQNRWVTKTMLRAWRDWKNEVDLYATPPKENEKAIELCRRLGMVHKGLDETGQFEVFVKPATT